MSAALLGGVVLAAVDARAGHEVGTHGYLRIGAGFSGAGFGDRACFQAPGADWKYRLGNECDTWIEGGLHDRYQPRGEDGPVFYSVFWLGLSAAEGRMRPLRSITATQLFIEASRIRPLGRETRVWVGRRYYQRHDIHLLDMYWAEMLGDGLGVEDIVLPSGKLMYAFTRSSDSIQVTYGDAALESEVFQNNHDLRLYDVPLGLSPGGKLTLQVMLAHAGGNRLGAVPTQGFALAAWHEEQWDRLWSKVSFQYGRGLLRNKLRAWSRDLVTTTSSAEASALLRAEFLRVTGQALITPRPRWAVMVVGVFQMEHGRDYDDTERTWLSAGARPMLYLNDHVRLLAEYGFDRTRNMVYASPGGQRVALAGNLHKITAAAELAPGRGFWTRPVIRVFATAAAWSDVFRGQVGMSGNYDVTVCSRRTSCMSAGVQVEYWW